MLSHVDKENLPTMVDVSDKAVTRRTAVALKNFLEIIWLIVRKRFTQRRVLC